MKNTIKRALSILALGMILGVSQSKAVDGLQIGIGQGKDVILGWPSEPGETYVITSATNLIGPWTVLESSYPATEGTNFTTYTHYDQVSVAEASGGTNSEFGALENSSLIESAPLVPMAMRADGSSDPVPLNLYPPGFDLSGFLIYDPLSEDWTNGTSLTTQSESTLALSGSENFASLSEESAEDSPKCGFYRVLGVRILSGITNGGIFSDYASIAARPDAGVNYLQVLVDGQRMAGQDILLPPFTNVITFDSLDSARVTNGTHTVQVEAVYHVPSLFDSGLHHALSQPFQVTFSNELSFPEWEDMTEDEVCGFDIVSAHESVDWEIDVYNIYDYIDWLNGVTTDIWPIHVATGSTTNGIIKYDWDLIDDLGYPRNDPYWDPYFVSFTYTSWTSSAQQNGSAAMSAVPSASTPNPIKSQPAKWPAQGHWVVAWQDMFRHLYDPANRLHNAFNSLLGMANLQDAAPFWQGPIGGTNAQTFPVRYFYSNFRSDLNPTNIEFYQSTLNDQRLLELMLEDSRARNFFYFGHGEPDWICSTIFANLLRDYGMHRYRFVWLDGCETGTGTWPETFGIKGPGLFSIEYYKERTKRPALFVGNKYSVPTGNLYDPPQIIGGVKYDGEVARSLPEFYIQFIFFWQSLGRPYATAVRDAQDLVKSAYPDEFMRYSSGPKKGVVYWPGDDQERIGYDDMGYNTYNYDYDIPTP